jgi:pimeloyl-ACP methyl ester carboxylesterase
MVTNELESGVVELYREVRGAGPIVLLIAGTPGDGGQFASLAAELSWDHTVVTYDRRATSRSPRPAGWASTSVEEQADDAARVLAGVTNSPALAYGTSNGGAVALELAMRHPERVSAAIVHEVPLLSVLANPAPVGKMIGEVIGAGMERGGPEGGLEAFLRFAYGDAIVDQLAPDLRARMCANAAMVFSTELPAFQSYRPHEPALGSLTRPVHVAVGLEQQVPMFAEAAEWLATRLSTSVTASPGAHGAHLSHPAELAAFIRAHDPNEPSPS